MLTISVIIGSTRQGRNAPKASPPEREQTIEWAPTHNAAVANGSES